MASSSLGPLQRGPRGGTYCMVNGSKEYMTQAEYNKRCTAENRAEGTMAGTGRGSASEAHALAQRRLEQADREYEQHSNRAQALAGTGNHEEAARHFDAADAASSRYEAARSDVVRAQTRMEREARTPPTQGLQQPTFRNPYTGQSQSFGDALLAEVRQQNPSHGRVVSASSRSRAPQSPQPRARRPTW